ncbi:MAG: transposase, partial [Actinomycetota bacterium]|nr:transposase [Actinomycetota bacterium]
LHRGAPGAPRPVHVLRSVSARRHSRDDPARADIQTWWPQIEAFLRLRVTNARTEGTNRVIKQIKRTGCGYRNQTNYERRIVLHVAAKSAA